MAAWYSLAFTLLFRLPPASIFPRNNKVKLRREGSLTAIMQPKQEEALFSVMTTPR